MSPHLKNISQKPPINDLFQHYLQVLFTNHAYLKQHHVNFLFLLIELSFQSIDRANL